MEERIDLVVLEQKQRSGGISLAVVASLVLHTALLVLFIRSYRAAPKKAENVPMARYVELIQQNPREHVEAPGPEVDRAPLNAPLSDANRKASMPEPTGDQPTTRPGDGRNIPYTPPQNAGPRTPPQMAVAPQAPFSAGAAPNASAQQPSRPIDSTRLVYRDTTRAAAASGVDWKNAIREIGKVASLGGDGLDLDALAGGGLKGYAETGPLSFETGWYDWGDYAQSMVSKIRVNWYENMPAIIHTGLQGQVTIRFTIHRDGRVTNIEVLKRSGHPPYDHAAEKAIQLSSPLKPLPEGFPNPTERVTALFFYNMEIPR